MGLDYPRQKVAWPLREESFVAMSRIGPVPIELVLPTGACQSRRGEAHERDRRTVYEVAVLRKPKDGYFSEAFRVRRKPEAGSEAHARDGYFWAIPRSPDKSALPEHVVYPYLLDGVMIENPNHVWSTDITYIRLLKGFAYLVAILDCIS